MTQVIVLPHPEICPEGALFEAKEGESLCQNLIDNGVFVEHACAMSCACSTCHVVIREGFGSLQPSGEEEDDLLDRAWGLEPHSRLSCQAVVGATPLVVEIPRYSINRVREGQR